jgi:hypothetical protein
MDMDTLVVKMVKTIVETGNAQRGTFFEVEESTQNILVSAECEYQNGYDDRLIITSYSLF